MNFKFFVNNEAIGFGTIPILCLNISQQMVIFIKLFNYMMVSTNAITPTTILPMSSALATLSNNEITARLVEWPFLKPYWCSQSIVTF